MSLIKPKHQVMRLRIVDCKIVNDMAHFIVWLGRRQVTLEITRKFIPNNVGIEEDDFNRLKNFNKDRDKHTLIMLKDPYARDNLQMTYQRIEFDEKPYSTVVGDPIWLKDVKIEPITYLSYHLGGNELQVQRDGFVVYAAPTGNGKTYFAIHQIKHLWINFDIIVYLNYEINANDLLNRFQDYKIPVPENLIIWTNKDVDSIVSWLKENNFEHALFIVDNLDNLISGHDNAFGKQLDFVHKLSKYCKENNSHAIVLTQVQKDTGLEFFDKRGKFKNLNTSVLSGVKQIGDESRTAIFTAWNDITVSYEYKVLKMGTGRWKNGRN